MKFDVFWTPSKFLFDEGCLPFYNSYFCASLALFYMFVFQKYIFFLIFNEKLHFLLKFLFVFSDELMRRWNVDWFEDLLCLFDDNTLEIDFLGFYSALTLCGYRLWSIVINKILSAHGIKHTKRLRYLLYAFLCRYYCLKMPVKQ